MPRPCDELVFEALPNWPFPSLDPVSGRLSLWMRPLLLEPVAVKTTKPGDSGGWFDDASIITF